MDFMLFENGVRFGLSYLVIETGRTKWTLMRTLYAACFYSGTPAFRNLEGMTCRRLQEKEAIQILQQHRDIGEVAKFLRRYEMLPF